MKKTLLGLVALSILSSASAATYVGGSLSIKNSVGGLNLHYQKDRTAVSAIRYSLDLDALNVGSNGVSVGGSADLLTNLNLQSGLNTSSALTPYYGYGLGAYATLGDISAIGLYPHGLLGAKFQINQPLSVFAELNAGPRIVFVTTSGASATNVDVGWGARVGLNYRLGTY